MGERCSRPCTSRVPQALHLSFLCLPSLLGFTLWLHTQECVSSWQLFQGCSGAHGQKKGNAWWVATILVIDLASCRSGGSTCRQPQSAAAWPVTHASSLGSRHASRDPAAQQAGPGAAGDHLYRMNYQDFVNTHRMSGADITVAALPTSEKLASAFGLMKIDGTGRIVDFAEKPQGEALRAMAVDTTVLGLSADRWGPCSWQEDFLSASRACVPLWLWAWGARCCLFRDVVELGPAAGGRRGGVTRTYSCRRPVSTVTDGS